MKLFASLLTDGYKANHHEQFSPDTTQVYSNFTPRTANYARRVEEFFDRKMVYFGLQYTIKEYLINQWNDTFFKKPKEEVLAYYTRRIDNYLGAGKGEKVTPRIAALHDLGYLPLRIKSLEEGSRVNEGVPVFTITNTHPDFFWLTNYVETILSVTVWPACNAASLSEQYYKLSKYYGELTGASPDFWLPFANHDFSMRGHRCVEDAIVSGAAHLLFHRGTDTIPAIDFLEDYYGANSDRELVGCSVSASEHATNSQMIAVLGSEDAAFKNYITNIYPTGICAYVADTNDYYDVITRIVPANKEVILARQPDANGMPACVTLRPDSSPKTPLEIICGDLDLQDYNDKDLETAKSWMAEFLENKVRCETTHGEIGVDTEEGYFLCQGKHYRLAIELFWNRYDKQYYYIDGYDIAECVEVELTPEQIGTLQSLWNTFGGTEVVGSNGKSYKAIDGHVKVLYGEAISLEMSEAIYKRMEELGWSVSNVLYGVGSWAHLEDSSRDSYGLAMKATHSTVNGEAVEMSKNPKTSSFKKSAKGLLRVEKEGDDFVLYDQQTWEQEAQGELKTVFLDGVLTSEVTLNEIRERIMNGV